MRSIARVSMPEKGQYAMRAPEGLALQPGAEVVVELDYGEDCGVLLSVAPHDPERERYPRFSVLRTPGDEDRRRSEANVGKAAALGRRFAELAEPSAPGIRVVYSRLSLGGGRLFLRYVCDRLRPDIAGAMSAVGAEGGTTVSAWQMGQRDEVRSVGAVGPCGRVCCCCSWQKKYPSRASDSRRGAAVGICGRRRCCHSFEEGQDT